MKLWYQDAGEVKIEFQMQHKSLFFDGWKIGEDFLKILILKCKIMNNNIKF